MSEFDADFQDVLVENTAQAVLKRLQQLSNARDRYKYRWVWELLQNASDAAESSGVRVSISLVDGRLTFAHTGKPFTNKNIGHLIYHGSTKQGDDEAAGRFGTGFMTSHLISKQVHVRGSLEDGRRFDFHLSREGDTADELHTNMDRSRDEFEQSLCHEECDSDFGTSYEYPVHDDIAEDVAKAIDDLRRHAPLVLVFNPRLTGIHIDVDGEQFEIAQQKPRSLSNGFTLHPIGPPLPTENSEVVSVVSSQLDAAVNVAVVLRRDDDQLVVDVDDDTPRLFVLFPLLGTESFSLPMVINSRIFEPTEDRDGVYLWTSQSEKTHDNEQLIEQAIELCLALARLAADEKWERPDRLARVRPIARAEWLREEPFRQLVREKLITPLQDCSLVVSTQGSYLSPRAAALPIPAGPVSSSEIWQMASSLPCFTNRLPRQKDVVCWAQIMKEWAQIYECDAANIEGTLTLDTIARTVSATGSVLELRKALADETDAFGFLNDLFRLMREAGLDKLFIDIALLPNQTGEFCTRGELFFDDNVDNDLKDIAESLGLPGRAELLATEVENAEFQQLLNKKTQGELLAECVAELKRRARSHETERSEFLTVNATLLQWMVAHECWVELDEYPALTRDKSVLPECVHRLDTEPATGVELPLSPPYAWPENATRFVELFPPKLVLTEDYATYITAEQWQALAAQGFVRVSPLFEMNDTISCFLPDETWALDDEEHRVESTTPVQVSQIAFLNLRNQGLIDRVRRGRERAVQFVDFICSFVLDADERAFEKATVSCNDEKTHEYYRANWLAPLVGRSWVPMEKASAKASAESLGQLLRGHTGILDRFAESRVREWLSAMRISIADLTLHTLAEEEDTRISLMGSISDLARAAGGDADRVRRLAAEISASPQLMDQIEDHSRVRKVVQRNQSIGKLVEELLSSALATAGLSVSRTGVGSDYEVESDQIEDEEEQWLKVEGAASLLIEIKSARAEKVGMTVTQAKMAVTERSRFALCIVVVDTEDLVEDDVRANAWFVTDIGDKLETAVANFEEFETTQSKVRGQADDSQIEIDISDSETRFRIATALAKESGLDFDSFVAFVKERARCSEPKGTAVTQPSDSSA